MGRQSLFSSNPPTLYLLTPWSPSPPNPSIPCSSSSLPSFHSPFLLLSPSPPTATAVSPSFMDLDISTEIHHFFQMFDHNGDGKITVQELSTSLESLGIFILDDVDLDDMTLIIHHMEEENGGGSVNMEEFRGLYETVMEERDEEEDIREAFNVFDKNGDGFITVEELMSVLNSLGLKEGRTMEDCRMMVKKVDEDGDGMVDFRDFRKMMMMKGGGFDSL